MNKQIMQTFALALLLFAGGCSNESSLVPEPAVKGEITIQTRAGDTEEHRLLAFNPAGACVLNQVISPSGTPTTLSLDEGSYEFFTFTGANQFDLPVAGETDDITFTDAITLSEGESLTPFKVSRAASITIPTDPVYAVDLKIATCDVALEIESGASLAGKRITCALKNMYNGFRPDGLFPATVASELSTVETVACFPTDGAAVLVCQIEGEEPEELTLKTVFLAGGSYRVKLTYKGLSFSPGFNDRWSTTTVKEVELHP